MTFISVLALVKFAHYSVAMHHTCIYTYVLIYVYNCLYTYVHTYMHDNTVGQLVSLPLVKLTSRLCGCNKHGRQREVAQCVFCACFL